MDLNKGDEVEDPAWSELLRKLGKDAGIIEIISNVQVKQRGDW